MEKVKTAFSSLPLRSERYNPWITAFEGMTMRRRAPVVMRAQADIHEDQAK
jgi:hypothetical protein